MEFNNNDVRYTNGEICNEKPLKNDPEQSTSGDESDFKLNIDEAAQSMDPKDVIDSDIESRNVNKGDDLSSSLNEPLSPSEPKHKSTRSQSWCGTISKNDRIGAEMRYLKERLSRTQSIPQPATIRNFTIIQKSTLLSLALVDFMSFCSMSIMAPFFPKEASEKGLSEAESGFVFSFYALVMFITSPMFGKIIPSVGAKFLFLSGIFMAGSCNILFGFLEYIYDYKLFLIFCFLIRGFEALGASAYSTASYVFVINTFPDNIGSVLGILETFVGLGMSVGPAIGGLLYSIGGFELPFFTLGIAMVIILPINYYLLPSENNYSIEQRSGSIIQLIKIPTVIITGMVIVVVSNIWSFLDPTLEPHLRKFDLSIQQVGLIFLLFSVLYGIFSPIWGWVADKINHHWCMMVWGLLACSFGLLLLGPSPLIPFLESSILLNIIGLSIIGIAVALTLLPTFQGVLSSCIEEGQCSNNLATYSVVAGVWSCMYSLGEMIGPILGGVLLKHYGFPICSTIMAILTLFMALLTFCFFAIKETTRNGHATDQVEALNGESSCSRASDLFGPKPTEEERLLSKQPLNASREYKTFTSDETGLTKLNESKRPNKRTKRSYNLNKQNRKYYGIKCVDECGNSIKITYKKNQSGLPPKLCDSLLTKHISDHSRYSYSELLQYNVNKVNYYRESRKNDGDGDQVTDVKGTIELSSSGACEV